MKLTFETAEGGESVEITLDGRTASLVFEQDSMTLVTNKLPEGTAGAIIISEIAPFAALMIKAESIAEGGMWDHKLHAEDAELLRTVFFL